MRLDADVAHASRDRSAKVMQPPRLDGIAEAAIEIALAVVPYRESGASACSKQMAPAGARHRFDDRHCSRQQRNRMSAAVLRSLRRQCPHAGIEIELAPAHATDLRA